MVTDLPPRDRHWLFGSTTTFKACKKLSEKYIHLNIICNSHLMLHLNVKLHDDDDECAGLDFVSSPVFRPPFLSRSSSGPCWVTTSLRRTFLYFDSISLPLPRVHVNLRIIVQIALSTIYANKVNKL